MSFQVDAQAAYVLHSRPYRDTSLLVDLFTLEQGKISAVVKGARSPRSRFRAALQPFTPLQVGWRGRHELKTLIQAEPVSAPFFLTGSGLMCGLYVNEMLQRLLQPFDPYPRLYVYYQYVLNELLSGNDIEVALRVFERHLLKQLGYDFDFQHCIAGQLYQYSPESGFRVVAGNAGRPERCFSGEQLQAIAIEDYARPDTKRAAKRLMRIAIESLLGHHTLRSRELFQKYSPEPRDKNSPEPRDKYSLEPRDKYSPEPRDKLSPETGGKSS
ncbi:MAG: DNA repair protein RecO [Amphritea sp.]